MFNAVQYVRDVCKERQIAISQLERDLGFANGYLNPKKMTTLPYARAVAIAEYLEVSVENVLGVSQEEQKNKPTTINGDELSEAERDFILSLRSIPEQERDMVAEMIRAALRSKGLL